MSKITAKAFTIDEMWRVSQRNNSAWGIEGYDVPRKYADYRLIKWKKDIAALPEGKYLNIKKAITKKGHYLDFQYKSQNVSLPPGKEGGGKVQYFPGPARYQKTIGKVADELKERAKVKQKKLDVSVMRKDHIWHIMNDAKMAPERGRKRPGPGTYFDSKEIEARAKKFIQKDKQSKAVRTNFLMEYEHLSAQVPGPGQYYPRKCFPHHNIKGVRKNPHDVDHYRKKHQVGSKKEKKKKADPKTFMYPEQLKYTTFRKVKMKMAKPQGAKKSYWGSSKRFHYQREVGEKAPKKPVKTKKGKGGAIGPGSYNVDSKWGLDLKTKKTLDIQKKRCKAVYSSIYYSTTKF